LRWKWLKAVFGRDGNWYEDRKGIGSLILSVRFCSLFDQIDFERPRISDSMGVNDNLPHFEI
jgi:hypothetical protein